MSKIKLNFTPSELAEKERELERQRDLQHALAKTLGERVTGSAEFEGLQRNLRGSDNTGLTFASDKDVHLASLEASEVKTLIRSSGTTSAGPFLTPESGPPAAVPARAPRMLDLVRSGEMTSDSVTFARQDTYAPVSVSTPEATSTTTGTKPEATLSFAIVSAQAQTYASYVPVTRRSLSDSEELRSLVDTRLMQDSRQALETALLADVNTNAGQSRTWRGHARPQRPQRHHGTKER
jgi:HK97 family phage major capsid protein